MINSFSIEELESQINSKNTQHQEIVNNISSLLNKVITPIKIESVSINCFMNNHGELIVNFSDLTNYHFPNTLKLMCILNDDATLKFEISYGAGGFANVDHVNILQSLSSITLCANEIIKTIKENHSFYISEISNTHTLKSDISTLRKNISELKEDTKTRLFDEKVDVIKSFFPVATREQAENLVEKLAKEPAFYEFAQALPIKNSGSVHFTTRSIKTVIHNNSLLFYLNSKRIAKSKVVDAIISNHFIYINGFKKECHTLLKSLGFKKNEFSKFINIDELVSAIKKNQI